VCAKSAHTVKFLFLGKSKMAILFRGITLGFILSISLMVATEAVAARLLPIVDQTTTFDDEQKDTVQQVRGYILAGAEKYADYSPYKVESDINGEVRLTFEEKNEFSFTVLIAYDRSGFQLKYVTSNNLNYKENSEERLIHSSYSAWTNKLIKEIKLARKLRLTAYGEPTDKKAAAYVSYRGDAKFLVAYGSASDDIDNYERILIDRYVPPQSIHIVGSSSKFVERGMLSCGPICLTFLPEGGKQYRVEWKWYPLMGRDGGCGINVAEVSESLEEKWIGKGDICPPNKSWLDRLSKQPEATN
jgi:hypothetical protein